MEAQTQVKQGNTQQCEIQMEMEFKTKKCAHTNIQHFKHLGQSSTTNHRVGVASGRRWNTKMQIKTTIRTMTT